MLKAVLFDMDGTLTPARKAMERSVLDMLKGLHECGYEIGIVTGSGMDYIKEQCSIMFEDFNFDPYYGSTADPKTSHIIFRNPKTTKVVAKFMANSILQDDDFDGPMTNAFGNSTNSSMSMGYGGSSDQPIDVNAIILDWMKQIKNFY